MNETPYPPLAHAAAEIERGAQSERHVVGVDPDEGPRSSIFSNDCAAATAVAAATIASCIA